MLNVSPESDLVGKVKRVRQCVIFRQSVMRELE